MGKERSCSGLAYCFALIRRSTSDLGFNAIESTDAIEGLGSNRGGIRDMDVVKLATDMRPTGCLPDVSGAAAAFARFWFTDAEV
jgi:hypothetical protein